MQGKQQTRSLQRKHDCLRAHGRSSAWKILRVLLSLHACSDLGVLLSGPALRDESRDHETADFIDTSSPHCAGDGALMYWSVVRR